MARPKKVDNQSEGQNPSDSYVSLVRIMKADKSIIEKGVEVQVPAEKLEDWLKRGLIKKK